MEEYNNTEPMPAGCPETELQEIKKTYSVDEKSSIITDGCGGLFSIICCG